MAYSSLISAVLWGFLATFITSLLLVLTKKLHSSFSLDADEGIQKVHHIPTPRIGGVSIVVGYFTAWLVMEGPNREIFGLIGLAGIPALAFGLTEDITKKIGVRARLLATIASGMIFVTLTGYSITHVDVVGLNAFFALPLFGFAFTAFAIGGLANAINLIDGFHGLAAGTLCLILLSFAMVGWRVEDAVIVELSLLMLAIIAGFLVINFPLGKLFLGDAGAYFAGFYVATLAVMLPARNPEVSPWVSLLILGYPVTETLYSVVRRLMDRDAHPGEPDNAHLHHIVHRIWSQKLAATLQITAHQNAITGFLMWTLPLVTLGFSSFTGLQTSQALFFLSTLVVFYVAFYRHGLARDASF